MFCMKDAYVIKHLDTCLYHNAHVCIYTWVIKKKCNISVSAAPLGCVGRVGVLRIRKNFNVAYDMVVRWMQYCLSQAFVTTSACWEILQQNQAPV